MAQITPLFKKNFSRPTGFIIHDLLMPDGSKRAYKATGKNAIAEILARYTREKRQMLAAMLVNWREA